MPCLLKINDCSVSAPHDVANYLNDFFSTIGSKLADRIDNSSKRDHFSYLTSRISSSIFLDIPSMTEINNAISSLNINKSYGHDQITPYFLQIAFPVVTPFLYLFVQFSFTKGIFPKNCTIAEIIPTFKKDDRQSPTCVPSNFLADWRVPKFSLNNCAQSSKMAFMRPKFCTNPVLKNTKCHISTNLSNFLKLCLLYCQKLFAVAPANRRFAEKNRLSRNTEPN